MRVSRLKELYEVELFVLFEFSQESCVLGKVTLFKIVQHLTRGLRHAKHTQVKPIQLNRHRFAGKFQTWGQNLEENEDLC